MMTDCFIYFMSKPDNQFLLSSFLLHIHPTENNTQYDERNGMTKRRNNKGRICINIFFLTDIFECILGVLHAHTIKYVLHHIDFTLLFHSRHKLEMK